MSGGGLTVGELLPRLLEAYGVDTVFGIPGVHNVELYRGLPATGIRHVTPRHEQGAGFMADGYARVTGKPGVCFTITGPGLTNILTAMGQAYADSVPMLVISSVNRTEHLGAGEGRLHELPSQRAMAAGVAAFSQTILHPGQLAEALARAFALFASARPRPVHLEIPVDVIAQPAGDLAADGLLGAAWPLPGRPAPDPAAVARAAALLRAARSPLMVLGGGAVEAGDVAMALAERLGLPVINTINAKGLIPRGHPLAAGENMAAEPLRHALRDADVVLAVGTEFGETEHYPGPTPLAINGALIRIDLDPEQLVRQFRAAVPMVADARLALSALLAAVESGGASDGAGRAAELRVRMDVQQPAWIAPHRRLMDAIDAALPGAIIVGDSTQPVYASNLFFRPEAARSFFNASTGYGTLGYGLPAAIGAKIAAPARPVVALVGDGGALFTLTELAAAVEARAPVVVILWNNGGYGEIRGYMVDRGIEPIGVDLVVPNFTTLAQGFGCAGRRVTGATDLRAALREASGRDVPTVLEINERAGFGE